MITTSIGPNTVIRLETASSEFVVPGSLRITRQRMREGPSPVWIVWRPNTAQAVAGEDAAAFSAILKLSRWPASTPTGQKLREWLESWGYVRKTAKKAQPEPQQQTKMIT